MELTVWCVFWGDKYHPGYVYALRDAVAEYLTEPHRFVCITASNLPGIQTRRPPVSFTGWWQKIGLFAPGVATGPSIYLDLDVVVVGSLDYLVPYARGEAQAGDGAAFYPLAAPANWAQSGHGGIQSSVMAWPGRFYRPAQAFDYPRDRERYWGDQEFLWALLGDDWLRLPRVCSYKYHCRDRPPPAGMSVVAFHGKPDPHEVSTPWILPYTSTLHSRIKSTMVDGSPRAFGVSALPATG